MKTKLFTLFFALVTGAETILAWDYENVKIDDLYYNLDATNQTAEVRYPEVYVESHGKRVTANIPATVIYNAKTYRVTTIGDQAFHDCGWLVSVTIPEGITNIGGEAFGICTSLKSITIPNSVTRIGVGAFTASGLTSIEIPNSVDSLHASFYNCDSLTSVTIGNGVTYIEPYTFAYCKRLTSVTLGNNITKIGEFAFVNDSCLKSINIPNSVDSIEMGAFAGCGLTNLTIPNNVTSIGDGAFSCNTRLSTVTIGNGVTCIMTETFAYCKMKSFTIPNSVTIIDPYAFDGSYIEEIYNYAATPPLIASSSFSRAIYIYSKLYVPLSYIEEYATEYYWRDFRNIFAIGAKEVEVISTIATTTSTTATVVWQRITGAGYYELIIRNANNNICILLFNAEGQLIEFHAPARGNAPQKTQTAGFEFTVTGLESGTTYNYSITAKNEGGTIINTQSGSFTTKAPQGIDDVEAGNKSTKILHNGQVLIHRGDKTYTLTGQEVK